VVSFAPPPFRFTDGTHWIGGRVGPRAGLDHVEKRNSLPYRQPYSILQQFFFRELYTYLSFNTSYALSDTLVRIQYSHSPLYDIIFQLMNSRCSLPFRSFSFFPIWSIRPQTHRRTWRRRIAKVSKWLLSTIFLIFLLVEIEDSTTGYK
jgi:hypothetical protein